MPIVCAHATAWKRRVLLTICTGKVESHRNGKIESHRNGKIELHQNWNELQSKRLGAIGAIGPRAFPN